MECRVKVDIGVRPNIVNFDMNQLFCVLVVTVMLWVTLS